MTQNGNCSVEAAVIENGKIMKGTLTLFIDEYVFAGKRTTVDWEKVRIEKGTVPVKSFLRHVEKPCIRILSDADPCAQFILEQPQLATVQDAIDSFIATARHEREANAARQEELRRQLAVQQQKERESQEQSEARIKAEKEQQEADQRLQIEQQEKEQQLHARRMSEKAARIRKEVENVQNQPAAESIVLSVLSKKAGAAFLDNPYRMLGISCLSTVEDANRALDKLKKLARLKALESYRSPFDLYGLDKPARDLSVVQNAITLLKDISHKWFWFAQPEACMAWNSGKYRIELSRDGQESGTFDLFLANYMYAVLCDPGFHSPETWKRVLLYYCFICSQPNALLLRSRFPENASMQYTDAELLSSFRSYIFKPLLALCERDDLDAMIRLHRCIRECGNPSLDGLTRNVLGKLVSWFTEKEADMMRYLSTVDAEGTRSPEKGREIKARGDAYCDVVEPVFKIVLRDFLGDTVRYEMIKESYRHTTYQLMYELYQCGNQSDAIYFANKCFAYCKSDDRKRIHNTFGEVNIKAIDWNIPHTGWDIKGDEFYYGRGCAVDYTQALYWYHKAADAGNMYSQNSIGICYQKGNGVPQNPTLAASWFEKAYLSGNPDGAYNLAESYFSGTGVKKDINEALKYWAEAARLGHPSAQQRRDEVFATVQTERRNHRARNHVCHDLGFQMTTGPRIAAEVTLNRPAYVYLVNQQGYQNYLQGNEFSHQGGYATDSPYFIGIPSSNHWYIIVDNGDAPIEGLVSSVKVKRL